MEGPTGNNEGGRFFLAGTFPRGGSTRDWCKGIKCAVAFDHRTPETPSTWRHGSVVLDQPQCVENADILDTPNVTADRSPAGPGGTARGPKRTEC